MVSVQAAFPVGAIVKFTRERNVQHGVVVGITNDLGFNDYHIMNLDTGEYQIAGRHELEEVSPATTDCE